MSRTHVSGGVIPSSVPLPGTELASAYKYNVFTPSDVTDLTPIPNLTFDYAAPLGISVFVEAYIPQIAQKTSPPLGDLMFTGIRIDGTVFQENYTFTNPTTGDGQFVYLQTPTFIGDGNLSTYDVAIENFTNGSHGAFVQAGEAGPALIRLVVA